MKKLYLVRHGTVYNPDRIVYRRLPGYHLSDSGRADARYAAAALRHEPIEAIYHSPLERAEETAAIINGFHSVPMIVDERIHEWAEDEKPDEVAARMAAFLDAWWSGPESVAVAVSHRDPIRALLHHLAGTGFLDVRDREPPYILPPCSIYRLTEENGRITSEFVCAPE